MSKSNTNRPTETVQERIIHEDNHLVVVNKLAGELVQGDDTGDQPLLEKVREYLRWRYQKPGKVFCGLVHRLDRPTSGLVIFAKTGKGLSRMNEVFKQRQVEKRYYAITKVKPIPEQGLLEHYLRKNATKNKSFVTGEQAQGSLLARLHYRRLASSKHYHLLEIALYTGRHHQIRAQLSHQGWPIKGDLKYGFDRSNPDGSISLHAGYLAWEHPVKKEPLALRCPAPSTDSLWAFFNPYLLEKGREA